MRIKNAHKIIMEEKGRARGKKINNGMKNCEIPTIGLICG
jgi:hypothetical protein